MTKMGIGVDYEGAGCVKITKTGYEPLSTPDSLRNAFLFNSKLAKDARVQTTLANWFGLPKGLNTVEINWDVFSSGDRGEQEIFPSYELVKNNLFGAGKGLSYDLPLYESAEVDSSGYYIGRRTIISFLGTNEDTRVISVRNDLYNSFNRIFAAGTQFSLVASPSSEQPSFFQFTADRPTLFNSPNRKTTIWNLPGDETPIQNGTQLPAVSGQPQVIISPTQLKVSKPGFNAYTATGTQLSVDTSAVPAKIISAQDVLVPSGTSFVPLGYPAPAGSVVDCHFYTTDGPIYYPAGPYANIVQARFRLNGSNIEFVNSGGAIRARFIVVAFDGAPQTSGANNVFRQFNDGTREVFQLLRPGASTNPSFADIAVDSRWPAIQILSEGYIPAVTGTNRQYVINYDSAGTFPFIKFMTVHGAGSEAGQRAFTTPKMVRLPQVTMWNRTGGTGGGWPGNQLMGGNTCFVEYGASQAIFRTSVGDPMWQTRFVQGSGQSRIESYYDAIPIAGIRYYVFGITLP